MDVEHLAVIRRGVTDLQRRAIERYVRPGDVVLDVAPQSHVGVRQLLPPRVELETLDINPAGGATYTADLCARNNAIPSERFDHVFCTEVLEHTLQPFDALGELHRMLTLGGYLVLSVPFNFRIHGPLPDCWRFTEHGLRALLRSFEIEELVAVETTGRPLMPVQYQVIAKKPAPTTTQ